MLKYKRGHVLKQIKKLSYPKHLIFVDSETNINMVVEPKGKVVKYEVHTFKLGTACYVKLDENMNIVVERWISTTNPADIHDFIVKHAPAWGKLFVFAHNFHFDFPVLKLYELISKYNYFQFFSIVSLWICLIVHGYSYRLSIFLYCFKISTGGSLYPPLISLSIFLYCFLRSRRLALFLQCIWLSIFLYCFTSS